MARSLEKQRSLDDKSKTCELTEIVDPAHCRTVALPDSAADPTNKVFPTTFLLSRRGFKQHISILSS